MTIDIIEHAQSSRVPHFQYTKVWRAVQPLLNHRPITHAVIVFGGWGGVSEEGLPLDTGKVTTGTTQLVERIRTLRSDTLIAVQAYQGTMSSSHPVMDYALNFIWRNFHPLGKLIISGFSVGGMNAMQLSSIFYLRYPYYNVSRGYFERFWPQPRTRSKHRDTVGFVRVDLLLTIDPAAGPFSAMMPRRVMPSVRRNINIFQTYPSGDAKSHGGPTEALDPQLTTIDNHNWSDRYVDNPSAGHGRIDNDSIDLVVSAIRDEMSLTHASPCQP